MLIANKMVLMTDLSHTKVIKQLEKEFKTLNSALLKIMGFLII